MKDIKNHPFFNDINWKDVLRKKYKYQKQYLKIDLTKSNFDNSFDGQDKFDIGIDVEEECKAFEEIPLTETSNTDFKKLVKARS